MTTPAALPDDFALALLPVAEGLAPITSLAAAPGDDRLYVVQRHGVVHAVEDGAVRPQPFLDISADVLASNEQGLLDLAFHPGYAANRRLIVHYTDRRGDTRVDELRAAPGGDTVDAGSRRPLVFVDQPHRWHNGGALAFAPDGTLLIALGDGGDGFQANAQDPTNLLGAVLRIDVDRAEGGRAYAIPPGNPFADGGGGAPEVWAYGLRNPWRIAVDGPRGLLYIGDVGKWRSEEVDVAPVGVGGQHYGWPAREGTHCHEGDCAGDYVDPVLEYGHVNECAIVLGAAYRGRAIPELAGHVLYTDHCAGFVRSFAYVDGAAVHERDWTSQTGAIEQPTVIAPGPGDELYAGTLQGQVLRLARDG